MDIKKQIRNFQLTAAIASTVAVLSYFIGIFHFRFETLLGELSGGFFKIMQYVSDMADVWGIDKGEVISKIFSQIDSDAISGLTVIFIAAYVIPFILNAVAAIIGFVSFGKKKETKSQSIIALIASAYTVVVAILIFIGVYAIKNEMGGYAVLSLGAGYYIQIIAVITAIAAAIILLVYLGKKETNVEINETDVGLVGVCGMWKDAEFFNNSGRPIVIGRDPSQCDVVISENAEKVSRKHCSVNFDYKNNMYIVTDHSTNGTHLDNGKKLIPELPTPVECGTVIIIGNEKNAFRLN